MLNTFYRVSIFLREEPINKQTARQTACFFTLMPHRADVKHRGANEAASHEQDVSRF